MRSYVGCISKNLLQRHQLLFDIKVGKDNISLKREIEEETKSNRFDVEIFRLSPTKLNKKENDNLSSHFKESK